MVNHSGHCFCVYWVATCGALVSPSLSVREEAVLVEYMTFVAFELFDVVFNFELDFAERTDIECGSGEEMSFVDRWRIYFMSRVICRVG